MRIKNRLSLIIGVLTLALFFSSIGFVVGYYRYSGQISQEKLERQKEQEILNALIKAQQDSFYNFNKQDDTAVTNYGDTITKDTIIIYKILYTQCQNTTEEREPAKLELIGLNEKGFEEYVNKNLTNTEIQSFSKEQIVLEKRENRVCPNHYLISVNNGYIAIYQYDEDGVKQLVDQTGIPITILPIVDQEKLQRGILVETLEDVNELLEDYSS